MSGASLSCEDKVGTYSMGRDKNGLARSPRPTKAGGNESVLCKHTMDKCQGSTGAV